MFKVESHFIGKFKIGDNINYTLKVLSLLYYYFDKGNDREKQLLCKPIIILLISIIEAILYDLYYRIYNYTQEGIANIDDNIVDCIRKKTIDKFEKYITSAKKYNFFDSGDDKFYEALYVLNKVRNRIHIQNVKEQFENNEEDVFTEKRKILTEKVLEKILKQMIKKYSRGEAMNYVNDFELPWNEYFFDNDK